MTTVTAEAIRAAHRRIPAAFRDTPQFVAETLSESLGVPVVVKVETANPIGCFKGRGTWLAVAELAASGEVGERQGLVVASAGNFGQGVAYAGRALNVPVIIFAAHSANPAKLAAMHRLGADVHQVGEDFDAAREAAAAHVTETAWHLLVDGEDPWISIGAGGIGAWMHAVAPRTRVVGVQAAQAPAMTLSWNAGRPIATERADTVADGIAARVPVPEALELMIAGVDEMRLIDEATIIACTAEMSAALPLAVEPSAGAASAAARQERPDAAIALVLTGGNVAPPD